MRYHPNRILCIEDDEPTCQMMKVLLKTWNYDVVAIQTATDGFRQIQRERFALYLLDTSLPDEPGVELCKRICELDGHAPIVFISGHAYEADIKRGLQAGAHAYFTKPVDFDLLKETMARLIYEVSNENSLAA